MSSPAKMMEFFERREKERKAFEAWIERYSKAPEEELKRLPFERILNGRVVVVIHPPKYEGALMVPDSAERAPTKGTIVAKADDITDLEVGQHILYSQFAGYLLRFGGNPLMRIMGRDEILSVLKKDAPEISMEGA